MSMLAIADFSYVFSFSDLLIFPAFSNFPHIQSLKLYWSLFGKMLFISCNDEYEKECNNDNDNDNDGENDANDGDIDDKDDDT